MSTFHGFVSEFPLIRIDQFRPNPGKPPPLACFLSHIHSDHLVGLESLKSPFVYCSSATRELLLRLEKYPHRMNFAKGILECRIQTYKHLCKLLKPLPLDTPIKIELCSGNDIQVTLFDANHCIGSVMFLVEGQGKAILYTGDIRSEAWWVNALVRNPILLRYSANMRRLDKIYLDTTFAVRDEPHRQFPSKAEGTAELLDKISKYPHGTVFYFNSWTFGYEDVWMALSNVLHSPIHLDRYRHSLYMSTVNAIQQGGLPCRESPSLAGFRLGNNHHPGILTRNPEVRVHSCEKGSPCHVFDKASNVVTITPIISRHAGIEIRELGAGGGKGDLNQAYELDLSDPSAIQHLLQLCASSGDQDTLVANKFASLIHGLAAEGKTSLSLNDVAPILDELRRVDNTTSTDAIPLRQLPKVLAKLVDALNEPTKSPHDEPPPGTRGAATVTATATVALPSSITFPYSRHSSYEELRALVAAFRPRDIWPCTAVAPAAWTEDLSIAALFGDLCADPGAQFAHDEAMRRLVEERRGVKRKREEGDGADLEGRRERRDAVAAVTHDAGPVGGDDDDEGSETESESESEDGSAVEMLEADAPLPRLRSDRLNDVGKPAAPSAVRAISPPPLAGRAGQSARLQARREAYAAAQTGTWHTIELVSTIDPDDDDEELL